MSGTGLTTDPGLINPVWIDGVQFLLPPTFEVHDTLKQSLSPSAGRPRLDTWRYGDGLPNVPDLFEWVLTYDLSVQHADTIAQLGRLRTKGGGHLFVDWKQREYTWTARSGQQFFYLPRQDAYSLAYSGKTGNEYKAVAYRKVAATGVESAMTVVYKATVASGDTVTAGELWISNATETHPRAGFTVAAFKVGTTLAIRDEIRIAFFAAYPVAVIDVPKVPFEIVGREDTALYLAEIAKVS